MHLNPAQTQAPPIPPPIVSACLDDLVNALASRPNLTPQARQARAEGTRALILALQPQDAIQLMIAGQAVLFQTLAADCAQGLLSGQPGITPRQASAAVTAMGRLAARHLATLVKLRGGAARKKPAAEPPAPPAPQIVTRRNRDLRRNRRKMAQKLLSRIVKARAIAAPGADLMLAAGRAGTMSRLATPPRARPP